MRNYDSTLTKASKSALLVIALLFIGAIIKIAGAATIYPAGSMLQPNDVTSSHIRNDTIVDADINTAAAISISKLGAALTPGEIVYSNTTKQTSTSSLAYYVSSSTLRVNGNLDVTGTTTVRGVDYIFPATQGSAGTYLQTNGVKQLSWVAISSPQDSLGYFGRSTTTPATLDGTNTYFWASKAGSVYTLTQDVELSDLTISSGSTLNTGGYILRGTGTLTNSGTIQNNGGSGGNGGNATGGTAGAAAPGGSLTAGAAGQIGGAGTTATNDGRNGVDGTNKNPAIVGNGVAGGNGGASNGCGRIVYTGGVAGTGTAETFAGLTASYLTASTTLSVGTTTIAKINRFEVRGSASNIALSSSAGSGSGASGSSCSTGTSGSGGGSGATGGIVAIYFPTIIVNAASSITANGGNGGNGSDQSGTYGGGGGGGAGGNGGTIVLVYKTPITNSGTIAAVGGSGGSAGYTDHVITEAQAGTNGTAGKVYYVNISN